MKAALALEKEELLAHEKAALAENKRLIKVEEDRLKQLRLEKVKTLCIFVSYELVWAILILILSCSYLTPKIEDLKKQKEFNDYNKLLHEQHKMELAEEDRRLQKEYADRLDKARTNLLLFLFPCLFSHLNHAST